MTVSVTVSRIVADVTVAAAETTSGATREPDAYVSNSLCDTYFINLSLCDVTLLTVFHSIEALFTGLRYRSCMH